MIDITLFLFSIWTALWRFRHLISFCIIPRAFCFLFLQLQPDTLLISFGMISRGIFILEGKLALNSVELCASNLSSYRAM
jgi:hypothetical protein